MLSVSRSGWDAACWLHRQRAAFACFPPGQRYCLGLQMSVGFGREHFEMSHFERSLRGWEVLFTASGRKAPWGELLDGEDMGEGEGAARGGCRRFVERETGLLSSGNSETIAL